VEIKSADGRWFLVQEALTATGDLVVVRTDITQQRQNQQDLRQAKDEAERTLVDLREAQASLILSEKMASLGSLVAGMSHEISTPIGVSVSAASHLAEELGMLARRYAEGGMKRSDLDRYLDGAAEATRILQSNLSRASRLMRAFKQVAADQTSDLQRQFDLGDYLNEIMLSLAPAMRGAGNQVEVICPPGILVLHRPGVISQVITNLTMNAIQHAFADKAEAALIRIRVGRPRPDRIALEFSDNGCGIPNENLSFLFDPFFTTRRNAGGTGLGLHIVYNLVTQALGGTIAVSSRLGQGTRFTITFPASLAPDALDQSTQNPEGDVRTESASA